MGWRQTFYTFLLRRVLGPYLSPESLQQLYNSFEVSLQEGKFSLNEIELNPAYLSKNLTAISIQYVRIKKLQIRLSLGGNDETSVTWRAMNLGREGAGVSLEAQLEFEGVEIHIGPPINCPQQGKFAGERQVEPTDPVTPAASTTASRTIGSYIDAALASLRLGVDVKNVKLRFVGCSHQWIELDIIFGKYHDRRSHDSAMHKAVDFSGVTVQTFLDNRKELISKLEGGGQITLQASNVNDVGKLKQDVSVSLYQRVNLSVGENALRCILNTLNAFSRRPECTASSQEASMHPSGNRERSTTFVLPGYPGSLTDDEKDMQTIKGLMEQYAEARQLAERNEVRGGILVADDDNAMSFDAFFDANELSFSSYKSTLERSFLARFSASSALDYVHTQIKFYLGECRIKLSFPNPDPNLPSEYLLLTLSDCNASASISNQLTEVNCFIGRFTAETSQLSAAGLPEIENLWWFDDEDNSRSIVSSSPSLEIHFRNQGVKTQMIDIRLGKLTLCNNHRLLENFKSLRNFFQKDPSDAKLPSSTPEAPQKTINVSVWLSSLTLLVPVDGIPNQTFNMLFQRCGYRVEDKLLRKFGVLGLSMDEITFTSLNSALDDIADGVTGEKVTVHRAIVFVSSPIAFGSTTSHRVDVLAFQGQIPLILKHSKQCQISAPSEGESLFPKVPTLSSFKVREDDDIEGSDQFEIKRMLRSADPQPTLLCMARECHEAIELFIPDLILDLTKSELQALTAIVGGVRFGRSSAIDQPSTEKMQKAIPTSTAVALKIGQVTVCLHTDKDVFSFKAIGRDWKVFTVFEAGAIRCLRAVMHEIDLYAAQDLVYRACSTEVIGSVGVNDLCDSIRKRTIRNVLTKSYPIFYRSQLFPPLSPKSPAILLDLINTSDDECSEWTVHFSVYNMTHRATVESTWITYAQAFVASDQQKEAIQGHSDTNVPALKRVFVTLSDCNVDYTPAREFDQASRCIIRVSDLRVSSNVVSPPQQIQLFSVSVGDVTLLLGNKRHPYNAENACLLRSITILCSDDLEMVNPLLAPPDLQQLNLVTMLTLDSFVASITLRLANKKAFLEEKLGNGPNVSLNLTFGCICLYACKDSFECLMEIIGDLSLKFTGLTLNDVEDLRQMDLRKNDSLDETLQYDASEGQRFAESNSSDSVEFSTAQLSGETCSTKIHVAKDPATNAKDEFELDGYDWTAIDHKWSSDELPVGEEQVARWFDDVSTESESSIRSTIGSRQRSTLNKIALIPYHIQVKDSLNLANEGDMDAARYAGTREPPPVILRIIVNDAKARLRFFDGYDWPQDVTQRGHVASRNYDFIIDDTLDKNEDRSPQTEDGKTQYAIDRRRERRQQLMGALLDEPVEDVVSAFRDIPLPEERGTLLMNQAGLRRLSRRIGCFLQVSLSGLQLRMDAFEDSSIHRLASCLDLRADDLFIAETISSTHPTKLLGEWVNDVEHPRETMQGLVMMRMVTWNPRQRVVNYTQITPQESEALLQFLPLRCHIHQRALRFARAFFTSGQESPVKAWASHLTPIPPSRFVSARVKPCKLKVNYTPDKVDVSALRNGAVVELINISPLNDMVIMLGAVEMYDKAGFGDVFLTLARCWVQDICSTQLHKFVTNTSAFQPIASVSNDAVDMVVLPWDAIKSGGSVSKALKKGVHRFAKTVVYEALNVGSKVTNVAAKVLNKASSTSSLQTQSSSLPSRPVATPRKLLDTTDHSIETLAKGFETANHKIIIIPYREFRRSGASGAVTSVVKGIPVAVVAPVAAASEAISYTLLGARNQLRPEVRKEEEASQRGL